MPPAPPDPDTLADTLASLTLATSTARGVLVSSADLDDPRDYPFAHIGGRDAEARVLREWLLGGRSRYAPEHRPLGGAALVTGFRGVGKTTLVQKVLFDVSLAGLYGVAFDESSAGWGPFQRTSLQRLIRQVEQGGALPRNLTPRLYVPVHVDVANAIERRDLMERVLRRTYFALTRYQIGALRPDLMRRARLAYLRTLGKLESGVAAKVNEKLTGVLGANLEGLSKLEVTAQQEMEFAETLKLVAEELSIEEMEDELVDLGGELSDGVHGVVDGAGRRLLATLVHARYAGYQRLRQLFQGDVGRQVHLVYVFDELDKLDDGRGAPPDTADLRFDLQYASDAHAGPSRGTVGLSRPRASSSALASTAAVIRQLKILFSTTGLSAVVIGGAVAEEQWLDEVAERDPLLRSVFSRHVYVPQLALKEVRKMFPEGPGVTAHTPGAVCFWTRGRYKQLLRARGALRAGRLDDEFPHVPHEVLARLLGDFGATNPKAAPTPVTGAVQQLAVAPDLESVAAALLATAMPITRREAFGADVLRTLLVRVAIELLDPTLRGDRMPPEREGALRQRLAEMLPGDLHEPVLRAVLRLVEGALRPAAAPV